MNKQKRKLFFIKGNFQLTKILCFILLLFIEVTIASFYIYKLSDKALEGAAFKSHITVKQAADIIGPIIIKINIYCVLISVALAVLVVTITHFRLEALLAKIIQGLENLKDNNASFRINLYGSRRTRELIKEFNLAASSFEKRLTALQHTLDSLIVEKELARIEKLHNKIYSIIEGNEK